MGSSWIPPLGPVESCYSESAEWTLLAGCLAAATRVPFYDAVEDVLVSYQLDRHFQLAGPPAEKRRIGVALRDDRPVPLLIELSSRMDLASSPGFGGFGSMLGLATLLHGPRTGRTGRLGPAGGHRLA